MGIRQVTQTFPLFVLIPHSACEVTHPLKIWQTLGVFEELDPGEPPPLVYREQSRVLQRRTDPTTHLDGVRIEGKSFLIRIRVTRLLSRLRQIVKGFLPDCPSGEMMREFLTVLRKPLTVEPFHRVTGSGM
jgi:hypothetical protein